MYFHFCVSIAPLCLAAAEALPNKTHLVVRFCIRHREETSRILHVSRPLLLEAVRSGQCVVRGGQG